MRRTLNESNRPNAKALAQHAAELIEAQAGSLDSGVVSNKLSVWRPRHILEGMVRGARGYHEMRGEQDAFVHETRGAIYNTRKVIDPTQTKRVWEAGGMDNHPIVAPYHRIAMQGAHRIIGGPEWGGVHAFEFQGDVVTGEAKYTALRTGVTTGQGFVLRGADAWRHSIPHLQDIPGLLELQDPTRPGQRDLAYLSPVTIMRSVDEYLRRQNRQGKLDQPEGQLPAPEVDSQQADLFPYMSPLPPNEQWGWGDQRHGGLGGHNSHYGQ